MGANIPFYFKVAVKNGKAPLSLYIKHDAGDESYVRPDVEVWASFTNHYPDRRNNEVHY
jgi:hypothetical protein